MIQSICSSHLRVGQQLVSSFHPRLFHCSRVSQTRPPLLQLQSAIIPGLGSTDQTSTLDWTVNDAGSSEAWGVTGPAAEKGGAVKAEITKALLGLSRLRQVSSDGELVRHPLTHPFLRGSSQSTSSAIQLVSFSARLSSVGSAASNSFVDFSTRYGAIREEDRITLYESLMKAMGTQTGLVAKISLFPDPLRDPVEEAKEDFANGVTRLPWSSKGAEVEVRRRAKENHQRIMDLAPLLNLSHGDPPLLERPMIALSNGQTRRARIMSALCVGCEVLVLEEPFTGLDPPTRTALSNLLADLHAQRRPRVVCVLREQDELPPFLTHVLSIGEEGNVLFNGPIRGTPKTAADLLDVGKTQSDTKGGYEVVKQQATKGIGRGDESSTPAVELKNVSIAYKGKKVLDDVSLTLPAGSRTILVGDNGSGKTTLLSLLLGSHPQSYSLPSTSLTLFGSSRSDPPNATPLLLRRMGQLSPELVNAFPRRGLERGGLSVRDAVGSGFEGIFTRRARTPQQEERIEQLVGRFQGVIASSRNQSQAMDNLTSLLETPFHQLTPGSQTLILFLRSIVHSPRLLVLDEPFQGMSSSQVSHVRSFLDSEDNSPTRAQGLMTDQEREEEKQWLEKTAIVLVSHFEEEWLRGAGRLIRLKEGKVVESI